MSKSERDKAAEEYADKHCAQRHEAWWMYKANFIAGYDAAEKRAQVLVEGLEWVYSFLRSPDTDKIVFEKIQTALTTYREGGE